MEPRRIKITFPEHESAENIDLAVDSGFGGFGTAYRGEDPRVIYLLNFAAPYALIEAQLDVLQQEGLLTWQPS